MKSKAIAATIVVMCAAVGAYVFLRPGPAEGTTSNDDGKELPIARNIRETGNDSKDVKAADAAKRVRRIGAPRIDTEDRTDLSPADKKSLLAIEKAIDKEDLDSLLKLLSEVSASTNAEVRQEFVAGLGWFGKDALAEITPFMADPDEDVAEAARNAWELALSEIGPAKERLNAAIMALEVIADEDSLALIGSQFANTATELIDASDDTEVVNARRTEIVMAVESLIQSEKEANSAAARAVFEDITGHEWVSADETRMYLSDPDNYEPPEERVASACGGATRKARRRSSSARRGSSGGVGEAETALEVGIDVETPADGDGPFVDGEEMDAAEEAEEDMQDA